MADQMAIAISDLAFPGEVLAEALEERGMSGAELARRTGRSEKHISQLLRGMTTLSLDVALELERVLGIPARFWQNLEFNYRSELRRKEIRGEQKSYAEWMRQFPVRDMIRAGYLPEVGQAVLPRIDALLGFFGVTSPEAWHAESQALMARFRQSHAYTPDCFALTAWLRQGQLVAQKIGCAPYDEPAFQTVLTKARALTVEPVNAFQRQLRESCAAAGVALVCVPALPRLAVSGATRWISSNRALLQLSLRHRSNDQFWFSFFHEACHVLQHRANSIYVDTVDGGSDSQEEQEANEFARDLLIPPEAYRQFVSRGHFAPRRIRAFARTIGIAAGIVVGRLQFDGLLPHNMCNDLKLWFEWDFEMTESTG